jgi:hypothetical protein
LGNSLMKSLKNKNAQVQYRFRIILQSAFTAFRVHPAADSNVVRHTF